MTLHMRIVENLKENGRLSGYALGKTEFSIENRPSIRVDVHWRRDSDSIVWEVELKARYEEKLFKFHLLREAHHNIRFGLVVQREDSKRQVLKIAGNLFSPDELEALEVKTIMEITGKKIEESHEDIHPLFWVHGKADRNCVLLFSSCPVDDGFNRGLRLVGLYLKMRRYSSEDIRSYLIWLAPRLGLPEFEVNGAINSIEKFENFPSCDELRKVKIGRGPFKLNLGDLNLERIVCKGCGFSGKNAITGKY